MKRAIVILFMLIASRSFGQGWDGELPLSNKYAGPISWYTIIKDAEPYQKLSGAFTERNLTRVGTNRMWDEYPVELIRCYAGVWTSTVDIAGTIYTQTVQKDVAVQFTNFIAPAAYKYVDQGGVTNTSTAFPLVVSSPFFGVFGEVNLPYEYIFRSFIPFGDSLSFWAVTNLETDGDFEDYLGTDDGTGTNWPKWLPASITFPAHLYYSGLADMNLAKVEDTLTSPFGLVTNAQAELIAVPDVLTNWFSTLSESYWTAAEMWRFNYIGHAPSNWFFPNAELPWIEFREGGPQGLVDPLVVTLRGNKYLIPVNFEIGQFNQQVVPAVEVVNLLTSAQLTLPWYEIKSAEIVGEGVNFGDTVAVNWRQGGTVYSRNSDNTERLWKEQIDIGYELFNRTMRWSRRNQQSFFVEPESWRNMTGVDNAYSYSATGYTRANAIANYSGGAFVISASEDAAPFRYTEIVELSPTAWFVRGRTREASPAAFDLKGQVPYTIDFYMKAKAQGRWDEQGEPFHGFFLHEGSDENVTGNAWTSSASYGSITKPTVLTTEQTGQMGWSHDRADWVRKYDFEYVP